MCDECKCHDHGIGLFSRTHSTLEAEHEGRDIILVDDENLIEKKKQYEENPTQENLLSLAGAYSFQLRYREALALYEKAVKENPCYLAIRKRAITYLKLLMLNQAYTDFLWCKENTDDLLDVTYRLGLCKFYGGEYQKALEHFKDCFPLAMENPDMYISALYWYHICCIQLGLPMTEFKKYRKAYKNNFYTHPGYDLYVRYVSGEIDMDEFEYQADTLSQLQQTCAYYGMSVYLSDKDERRSRKFLKLLFSYEDYFGGFAYLAAYSDKIRNQE